MHKPGVKPGSKPSSNSISLPTKSHKTPRFRHLRLSKKRPLHLNSQRLFASLDAATSKYYSQSLSLPTTPYPLRPEGGSIAMESSVRPIIATTLYTQQLNPDRPQLPGESPDVTLYRKKTALKPSKRTRLPYRLHDGPPFANGDLHMGHFLNKTLKDIANRYKLARGFRIEFYPGWDCHGLPIELKALEATLGKSKPKRDEKGQKTTNGANSPHTKTTATTPIAPEPLPKQHTNPVTGEALWGTETPLHHHPHAKQLQLREMASKFAQSAIMRQKANMEQWSLLGDYNNPYITMDPTFEASETLVLGNLMDKNSLYRQLMPVYWSPSSKTALAESELEYKDITSTAVYVSMPVVTHGGVFTTPPSPLVKVKRNGQDGDDSEELEINPEGLSLLIWTTTPWTLPANRGICVAPEGEYAHVRVNTKMNLVWNGDIYEVCEEKNVIIIESQLATLSSTWRNMDGFNIDQLKGYLPAKPPKVDEAGQTVSESVQTSPPTSAKMPPGMKIVKKGVYDVGVHGNKAIVSKGKQKGEILDMLLDRSVSTTVVQSGVTGNDLAQCQYISPLSLKLNKYLMSDADTCVDVDIDSLSDLSPRKKTENDVSRESQESTHQSQKRPKFVLPTHKVIPAAHVLTDQGSGCVHTAPAHGVEDFEAGLQHGLPVACPVDEKGEYTADIGPELHGIAALEGGSKVVMNFLQQNGAMLHREEYEHRYPHDWRTLKPVMLRATSQWFCRLDEAKETAKNALNDVFVTTDQARTRLTSFIDSRDRWCISRQRYWGLPIPVFYSGENQENVLNGKDITLHLSKVYAILGTQSWWSLPSWRLLPPAHRGKVNQRYVDAGMDLDTIVNKFLADNGLEKTNIDSSTVKMSKNRLNYTTQDTLDESGLNDFTITVEEIDADGQSVSKKVTTKITHIDNEPVVGLPGDYYDCDWKVGEDTVDVWLDSGSSWFSALYNKISQSHLHGLTSDQQQDLSARLQRLTAEVSDAIDEDTTPKKQPSGKEVKSKMDDEDVNSLFGALTMKQTAYNETGDSDEFDPYSAIFGDLRSVAKKNHNKLISDHQLDEDVDELSWQADLYVEGSDQHRGWFQSSLLLCSLLTGKSPFKALHSHGFVVDEKGQKMSKSLGNGVEPNSIIIDQGHGVDVLRCWAASVDCSRDAMMGKTSIQNTIDFVRKWRGVMRFVVGSISTKQTIVPKEQFVKELQDNETNREQKDDPEAQRVKIEDWDFNPLTDLVKYDDLHVLDKYILHQLHETMVECETGYQHYQMHKVIHSLRQFMQGPLSSIYFDLSKDRLYASSVTDADRKAATTTLYYVFSSLLKVMTPVLPHLTQEIFSYLPPHIQKSLVNGLNATNGEVLKNVEAFNASKLNENQLSTDCVMSSGWVEVSNEWKNCSVVKDFDQVMHLRASVNQCLEIFRQQSNILAAREKAAQKAQSGNTSSLKDEQTAGTKGGKGNKRGKEEEARGDVKSAATAPAGPSINGDLALLPKVGSSNEVDVVITIQVPKKFKNLIQNEPEGLAFAKMLQNMNNTQFHELFMVASTTIQVDYVDDAVEVPTAAEAVSIVAISDHTTPQTSTPATFNIKQQYDAHSPSTQRTLLETNTSVKVNDQTAVNIIVGVAKSNGNKCPRCWRFSSPQDSLPSIKQVEVINSELSKATNTTKLYKSFIPTSKHYITQLAAELEQQQSTAHRQDILCQRCDDFFTDHFAGQQLHY